MFLLLGFRVPNSNVFNCFHRGGDKVYCVNCKFWVGTYVGSSRGKSSHIHFKNLRTVISDSLNEYHLTSKDGFLSVNRQYLFGVLTENNESAADDAILKSLGRPYVAVEGEKMMTSLLNCSDPQMACFDDLVDFFKYMNAYLKERSGYRIVLVGKDDPGYSDTSEYLGVMCKCATDPENKVPISLINSPKKMTRSQVRTRENRTVTRPNVLYLMPNKRPSKEMHQKKNVVKIVDSVKTSTVRSFKIHDDEVAGPSNAKRSSVMVLEKLKENLPPSSGVTISLVEKGETANSTTLFDQNIRNACLDHYNRVKLRQEKEECEFKESLLKRTRDVLKPIVNNFSAVETIVVTENLKKKRKLVPFAGAVETTPTWIFDPYRPSTELPRVMAAEKTIETPQSVVKEKSVEASQDVLISGVKTVETPRNEHEELASATDVSVDPIVTEMDLDIPIEPIIGFSDVLSSDAVNEDAIEVAAEEVVVSEPDSSVDTTTSTITISATENNVVENDSVIIPNVERADDEIEPAFTEADILTNEEIDELITHMRENSPTFDDIWRYLPEGY